MKLATIMFSLAYATAMVALLVLQIKSLREINTLKDKTQGKITKKMGDKLLAFPKGKLIPTERNFILLIVVVVLVSASAGFLSEMRILIVANLVIILALAKFTLWKYETVNGIYEKGLVVYDLCAWEKLHSWKLGDKGQISVLKKNGFRFDLPAVEDGQKTTELLSTYLQRET